MTAKHLESHWPMERVLIDWMFTLCEIYICSAWRSEDFASNKYICILFWRHKINTLKIWHIYFLPEMEPEFFFNCYITLLTLWIITNEAKSMHLPVHKHNWKICSFWTLSCTLIAYKINWHEFFSLPIITIFIPHLVWFDSLPFQCWWPWTLLWYCQLSFKVWFVSHHFLSWWLYIDIQFVTPTYSLVLNWFDSLPFQSWGLWPPLYDLAVTGSYSY